MQYKIITDTCCDFPAHMYQELDLAAVPLSVQFRGTYYESYTEEWLKASIVSFTMKKKEYMLLIFPAMDTPIILN